MQVVLLNTPALRSANLEMRVCCVALLAAAHSSVCPMVFIVYQLHGTSEQVHKWEMSTYLPKEVKQVKCAACCYHRYDLHIFSISASIPGLGFPF